MTDPEGNPVHSGDSITHLIEEGAETPLTVTAADGTVFEDSIPGRPEFSLMGIDYANEVTLNTFSSNCWYSQFASAVHRLEVPERPAAPEAEVTEITETSITLASSAPGVQYSADGGENWQESSVFSGLTPGETCHIEVYLPSTDSSFASEVTTLTVQTLSSSETLPDPSDPDEPQEEPETVPEQPSSGSSETDSSEHGAGAHQKPESVPEQSTSGSSETDSTKDENTDKELLSPITGDETDLPFWTAVLLLSTSGLALLLWNRKKQQ